MTATFSEPIVEGSVVMALSSSGGPVTGTLTYDPATRKATFTPATTLAWNRTYTVTVSGGRDPSGNVMTTTSWSFTTRPDNVAPTVSARSPQPDASGVAEAAVVSVTFSEPVVASSVALSLASAAGQTAGTLAYDVATRTATFTPSAPMTSGTLYTASVSGARDTAGNVMVASSWSFTTADTVAPTVSARSPASDATNVDPDAAVTATFSEPIVEGSVGMALSSSAGPVTGTLGYDPATRRATFTPSTPMSQATSYTVSVSGARDATGNVMAAASWSFTTADNVAPTVSARSPQPDASGVAEAAAVSVTFSEPVQSASVALSLASAAGQTAGTLAYDVATRTATFTPSAPMTSGTLYTASVSGARDTAGNVMVASSWSFTTGDTVAPTVSARSPASDATNVDPDTAVTATFSEPIVEGSVGMALSSSAGP